jgi:hypothetical protein
MNCTRHPARTTHPDSKLLCAECYAALQKMTLVASVPAHQFHKTWLTADIGEMWKAVPEVMVGDVTERAAIMEFDAKFTRKQADMMALAYYFGCVEIERQGLFKAEEDRLKSELWKEIFRKMRLTK